MVEELLLEVLKKHIAPDAHDSAFRDVVVFFGLRRVNHTLDEYLSLFQMALRRVEARFPVGATFPEIAVSSLCLQNAGLTTHQKSMVLTGTGGDPSLGNMIKHMRIILQPCGVDLKHDALMVDSDLNIANSPSTLMNGLQSDEDVKDAKVVSSKKGEKKKKKSKSSSTRDPTDSKGVLNKVNPRTG